MDANDDIENCFKFVLLKNKQSIRMNSIATIHLEIILFSYTVFPPKLWSTNETTKARDAFHFIFFSDLCFHQPKLHSFVKVLQDIETEKYMKISSSDLTMAYAEKNKIAGTYEQITRAIIKIRTTRTLRIH